MSKNVIIISSSPRKGGNSDYLCNKFEEGAKEAGNNVEKIFLKDKQINYCLGCGYCNSNPKVCSQKDDMAEIGEKLINADVIVLSTPVYFYTMSAQLKTFIDRLCPYYTYIKNKEFYFIATAADTNKASLKRTIDGLRGLTEDCLTGAKEKGIIYGTGVWHIDDVKTTSLVKQAYEMGKSI